jgi:hypothetical protein
MTSILEHLESATRRYQELPIFVAFAEDRIPLPRFTAFFREQAMAARHFQDFIWASTAIDGDDELARFAREHRRVDSGPRLVILAALEAAGTVTLGALHGYAVRHGLGKRLLYLGETHVRIEERQAEAVAQVAAAVFAKDDERLHELVRAVFDALTRMFSDGGDRIYGDVVAKEARRVA